jgi:hypothetical protein
MGFPVGYPRSVSSCIKVLGNDFDFSPTHSPFEYHWRADAVMCGLLSSAFSSAIACLEAFFGLAILQACAFGGR